MKTFIEYVSSINERSNNREYDVGYYFKNNFIQLIRSLKYSTGHKINIVDNGTFISVDAPQEIHDKISMLLLNFKQ
jgi:hypothetical protein